MNLIHNKRLNNTVRLGLRQMRKSVSLWLRVLPITLAVSVYTLANSVFAYSPQGLYDEVWKLVNARYVNVDKNGQDWNIWRHHQNQQVDPAN